MIRARAVLAVAVACVPVLVASGCGSGGGSTASTAAAHGAAAEHAVAAFLTSVRDGDWRAACTRLAPYGANSLNHVLIVRRHVAISLSEFDDRGALKNCPATLGRRGGAVKGVLARSDPSGQATLRRARTYDEATVPSPAGKWELSAEPATRPWMIERVAPDPPDGVSQKKPPIGP